MLNVKTAPSGAVDAVLPEVLVATGVVSGFGGASYELAVEAAAGLARQSQN